jgi:hypothetical protein
MEFTEFVKWTNISSLGKGEEPNSSNFELAYYIDVGQLEEIENVEGDRRFGREAEFNVFEVSAVLSGALSYVLLKNWLEVRVGDADLGIETYVMFVI